MGTSAKLARVDHSSWCELFDSLCIEQGYLDEMKFAERYCSMSGNVSQAAFDTALKNLRNWRRGANVPQRRNFLLLTRLLGIAEDKALKARWDELYLAARSSGANDERADARQWPSRRNLASIAVIGGLVAASGGLAFTMRDTPVGTSGFEGVEADYVRNFAVRIGDGLIIHGARGKCGEQPPEWEKVRMKLPELQTGKLTDGGLGTRYSRQCGGRTPARAILFTGTAPGVEKFSLYGDVIAVRVE